MRASFIIANYADSYLVDVVDMKGLRDIGIYCLKSLYNHSVCAKFTKAYTLLQGEHFKIKPQQKTFEASVLTHQQ
jgi:hypothetical protein